MLENMTKNQKRKGSLLFGVLALSLLCVTTVLAFVPIFFMGLLKLLPFKKWRIFCGRCIDAVSMLWCDFNNAYVNKVQRIDWHNLQASDFKKNTWYFVIANHQSWLDVIILHRLFNRKIPVLKFFIKDQLKWVPFLGFAWWAMGCPFMKRYSKEYLAQNKHKKGRDFNSAAKAIKNFKQYPASIMTFIEGTRFSKKKHADQKAPYLNLLNPKAGGMAFVLSTMGQQLGALLDVTIVYPEGCYSLWDFLCCRMDAVKVSLREIAVPEQFKGQALMEDANLHQQFRVWLNQEWAVKDRLIQELST